MAWSESQSKSISVRAGWGKPPVLASRQRYLFLPGRPDEVSDKDSRGWPRPTGGQCRHSSACPGRRGGGVIPQGEQSWVGATVGPAGRGGGEETGVFCMLPACALRAGECLDPVRQREGKVELLFG